MTRWGPYVDEMGHAWWDTCAPEDRCTGLDADHPGGKCAGCVRAKRTCPGYRRAPHPRGMSNQGEVK